MMNVGMRAESDPESRKRSFDTIIADRVTTPSPHKAERMKLSAQMHDDDLAEYLEIEERWFRYKIKG